MVKLYSYSDERYPDYGLIKRDGCAYGNEMPVELTEAEYADWLRVEDEYRAWQQKISELPPVKE